MDQRTDRAAGEGRIAIATNPDSGSAAIVEVRAESDFTAKNDNFVKAAQKVAQLAVETGTAGQLTPTAQMNAVIDEVRAQTGENCSIARAHKVIGESGATAFGSYVHHDGKTAALVQGAGSISDATLNEVAVHLAGYHIRAKGVSTKDIPADVVEKEKRFRLSQAIESGKPPEIAEKMVEGGMRKFFEEVALLEQPFVKDESKKIKDLVGKGQIVGFYRWQVGEQA
jgi:elongation factor Ts